MTEIRLECENCGSDKVRFDDKLGDKASVFCASSCGADLQTTIGEVRKALRKAGEDHVDIDLGPGWKKD